MNTDHKYVIGAPIPDREVGWFWALTEQLLGVVKDTRAALPGAVPVPFDPAHLDRRDDGESAAANRPLPVPGRHPSPDPVLGVWGDG